jgi:hypothetical protein
VCVASGLHRRVNCLSGLSSYARRVLDVDLPAFDGVTGALTLRSYPMVPAHRWRELSRRLDPFLRRAGARMIPITQ